MARPRPVPPCFARRRFVRRRKLSEPRRVLRDADAGIGDLQNRGVGLRLFVEHLNDHFAVGVNLIALVPDCSARPGVRIASERGGHVGRHICRQLEAFTVRSLGLQGQRAFDDLAIEVSVSKPAAGFDLRNQGCR